VIKAEQDLPGTEGGRRERVEEGVRWGEMTQTIYAHVNIRIKKCNYVKRKDTDCRIERYHRIS
jgi:hypothetical protein